MACRLWHMATEDDVRKAALALPGVTERPSWGQPAWFAKTLMARIWEPGVLTVKTEEREALAGTEPETYSWTPHHERSPQLVLVRLDRIDASCWKNCCRIPTGSREASPISSRGPVKVTVCHPSQPPYSRSSHAGHRL